MIRNLSYVLMGLMFQMSVSSSLHAEPAAAPHAALDEMTFDGAWGQKGSIWDGSALFLANGLRRQQAGAGIPESIAASEEPEKKSQAPWHEADEKFIAARLMAASS